MTAMNNISDRIKKIEERFKKLRMLMSREKWSDLNRMFFSFEQLPIHGKEYWFFLLTSNKPEKGRQVMVTFGNQNTKRYIVDNCEIVSKEGEYFGPFSYWFYDKGIHMSETMPSSFSMSRNGVSAKSSSSEFFMEGKYPRYSLKLVKNGKDIINVTTSKGSDHRKYDLLEYFRGGIGFGNVNLLVDFSGKLRGSPFKGQGYLQKVVITAPLPSVPWYWGRICFADKSVMSFLQPHLKLSRLSKNFATWGYFYDGKKKKEHVFEKIKVHKFGEKNRQFLAHGKSEGREFTMLAESYAQKKFRISSIGKLDYEQNLVRVLSFSMESGRKLKTIKDTGAGIGIMEDAYGYVI